MKHKIIKLIRLRNIGLIIVDWLRRMPAIAILSSLHALAKAGTSLILIATIAWPCPLWAHPDSLRPRPYEEAGHGRQAAWAQRKEKRTGRYSTYILGELRKFLAPKVNVGNISDRQLERFLELESLTPKTVATEILAGVSLRRGQAEHIAAAVSEFKSFIGISYIDKEARAEEDAMLRAALPEMREAVRTYGIKWLVQNGRYCWGSGYLAMLGPFSAVGTQWADCQCAGFKMADVLYNRGINGREVRFNIGFQSQNHAIISGPVTYGDHAVIVTDNGYVIDATDYNPRFREGVYYVPVEEYPFRNSVIKAIHAKNTKRIQSLPEEAKQLPVGPAYPCMFSKRIAQAGGFQILDIQNLSHDRAIDAELGIYLSVTSEGVPYFTFIYRAMYRVFNPSNERFNIPQAYVAYVTVPVTEFGAVQRRIKELYSGKNADEMAAFLKSLEAQQRGKIVISNDLALFPGIQDELGRVETKARNDLHIFFAFMSNILPLSQDDFFMVTSGEPILAGTEPGPVPAGQFRPVPESSVLRPRAAGERNVITQYLAGLDVDAEILGLLRGHGLVRRVDNQYEQILDLLVVYNPRDPARHLQIGYRIEPRGEMGEGVCRLFLFVPPLNRFFEIDPRGAYLIEERLRKMPANLLEAKKNDLGVNDIHILGEAVESPDFWTGWGRPGRWARIDRLRHGVSDRSDREYMENIDPECARRIQPLLERLYRRSGRVALLDIFAGSGDFVDMVCKEAGDKYNMRPPVLVERDTVNVSHARALLGDRGVVIEAGLGENNENVWRQLTQPPNIVTSIGGINKIVTSKPEAIAIARGVFDILPPGGIFVISGKTPCHLDRDDFESMGFVVEAMAIPENIFIKHQVQFYVLVKPDSPAHLRRIAEQDILRPRAASDRAAPAGASPGTITFENIKTGKVTLVMFKPEAFAYVSEGTFDRLYELGSGKIKGTEALNNGNGITGLDILRGRGKEEIMKMTYIELMLEIIQAMGYEEIFREEAAPFKDPDFPQRDPEVFYKDSLEDRPAVLQLVTSYMNRPGNKIMPVVLRRKEGNAIGLLREVIGKFDGKEPWTLRNILGVSFEKDGDARFAMNFIHASDSPENMDSEIRMVIPPENLSRFYPGATIGERGRDGFKPKLDERPTENGLLDRKYVGHDMAGRKIVNPDNAEKIGLYGGSGADWSNFILSTNATKAIFVDTTPVSKEQLEMILKYHWDYLTGGEAYLSDSWLREKILQYQSSKYSGGYVDSDPREKFEDIELRILFELRCMGVEKFKRDRSKNIVISEDEKDGTLTISFEWAYEGQDARPYSITFIKADMTDPERYPDSLKKVLKSKIDFYYQRAGATIPEAYWHFLPRIASSVKEGGFLITDDNAHFGNRVQPYASAADYILTKSKEFSYTSTGEVSSDELESWRSLIERANRKEADCYIFYGWDVCIRQKKSLALTPEVVHIEPFSGLEAAQPPVTCTTRRGIEASI